MRNFTLCIFVFIAFDFVRAIFDRACCLKQRTFGHNMKEDMKDDLTAFAKIRGANISHNIYHGRALSLICLPRQTRQMSRHRYSKRFGFTALFAGVSGKAAGLDNALTPSFNGARLSRIHALSKGQCL